MIVASLVSRSSLSSRPTRFAIAHALLMRTAPRRCDTRFRSTSTDPALFSSVCCALLCDRLRSNAVAWSQKSFSRKSRALSTHSTPSHERRSRFTIDGTSRPFAINRCVSSLNAAIAPIRNAHAHFTTSGQSSSSKCFLAASIAPCVAALPQIAPLR